ncbi:MAG: hypothetical protein RSD95_07775 [Clostridia bacterium]
MMKGTTLGEMCQTIQLDIYGESITPLYTSVDILCDDTTQFFRVTSDVDSLAFPQAKSGRTRKSSAPIETRGHHPLTEGAVCIRQVLFNDPATIVFWTDGTKTIVKANNEPFDEEKGLAMAICKRVCGGKGNYFNIFKTHCHRDESAPAKQVAPWRQFVLALLSAPDGAGTETPTEKD